MGVRIVLSDRGGGHITFFCIEPDKRYSLAPASTIILNQGVCPQNPVWIQLDEIDPSSTIS